LSTNEAQPRLHVSAEIADWSREQRAFMDWLPSRSLLNSIRAYQRHAAAAGPVHAFARRLALLRHRFWSVVTGADIPLNCTLGGGLLLPHPNGIVIHPGATVGVNCLIFQQVTIGAGGRPGLPRIGGHVDIGAGAKVLGGVVIGEHARIGANAVVLDDVPAGATAVGIPARLVESAS
jgi:serine O-acetyltransferase